MVGTDIRDYADKANSGKQAAENGFLFSLVKWLFIIVIILFVFNLITSPIRKSWANDYFTRGNTYLDQKKYLSAELEYQKALYLYPSDADAQKNLNLATKAESDISVIDNYFKDRKLDSINQQFVKAKSVPGSPSEAVKLSKELIESGEYQLAIIPAKTATEMDSNYISGWEYLAIANLYSSQKVEIGAEAKKKYLDEVSLAKSHLKEIPDILK